MAERSLWLAVVLGVLQGVVEWLPISSEGSVSLLLTVLGSAPEVAVRVSLFLHAGTGVAALVYYRGEVYDIVRTVLTWDPGDPVFGAETETTSFVVIGTIVSIAVAGVAYLTLLEVATELSGGAFIAVIGLLLIGTGVLQRVAETAVKKDRDVGWLDAVLVGAGQGVAVLPGISRSGTTVSVLLLRGHPGERSFRLSFLLSIPASFGAGVLTIAETGGIPLENATFAAVALVTTAVVGFATIGLLMRLVRRLPFWQLCLGLGGLAVAGGGLLLL